MPLRRLKNEPPMLRRPSVPTLALLAALLVGPVANAASLDQASLDRFAAQLQVRYAVLDNRPADCGQDECFLSQLSLVAPEGQAAGDWALYFSMEAKLLAVGSDQVAIRHVNGDLYELRPTAGFKGLAPGQPLSIPLRSEGTQVTRFYMMPNEYLVSGDLAPRIIDSTRPRIDPETGLESSPFVQPFTDEARLAGRSATDLTRWPTAARLYDDNLRHGAAKASPFATAILPTPVSMRVDPKGRRLDLGRGVRVETRGLARADIAAALADLAISGVVEAPKGRALRVILVPDLKKPTGAYSLRISPRGVTVRAADTEGASNALYSLAALIDANHGGPQAVVEDAPRFAFRGLLIDVARNFHDKAEILALLDQMARYKLNRLHLHLADDQGWRLEIPGLPELTELGSRRCHDLTESHCLLPQLGSGPAADSAANGYFTTADYVEIVRAAQARHIEVIPALDLPGHSRAAIKAMELRAARLTALGDSAGAARYRLSDPADTSVYRSVQGFTDNTINVCLESSYAFEEKVIDEIARMHVAAGQPLARYHIGGDETPGAWTGSPACQDLSRRTGQPIGSLGARFIERVAGSLAKRGVMPAAWSDGMAEVKAENMPAAVQSNSWEMLFDAGVATPHHQANQPGWQLVLSTPDVTYFDHPYSPDPEERGNGWAARDLETRKAFEFMPENLPAHAEVWTDGGARPAAIVDAEPLKPGVRFAGVQAQLFSEMIHSDAQVDYMLFPRLVAFADRAWHQADWEIPYDSAGGRHDQSTGRWTPALVERRDADWRAFAGQLGARELPRLDKAGIRYRVPPAGARIVDGKLRANVSIPGLPIEYRTVGGDWTAYAGEVAVTGPVEVRARSADGSRAGRATTVEP